MGYCQDVMPLNPSSSFKAARKSDVLIGMLGSSLTAIAISEILFAIEETTLLKAYLALLCSLSTCFDCPLLTSVPIRFLEEVCPWVPKNCLSLSC